MHHHDPIINFNPRPPQTSLPSTLQKLFTVFVLVAPYLHESFPLKAMAILLPSFSLRFARSSPGITGRTAIAAQLHQRPIRHSRLLSASLRTAYPRKDSQDRESINTDATEYSKSGSDDGAAAQERAAFEPGRADPYEAMQEAGKGVSPCPVCKPNLPSCRPQSRALRAKVPMAAPRCHQCLANYPLHPVRGRLGLTCPST